MSSFWSIYLISNVYRNSIKNIVSQFRAWLSSYCNIFFSKSIIYKIIYSHCWYSQSIKANDFQITWRVIFKKMNILWGNQLATFKIFQLITFNLISSLFQ